MPPPTPPPVPWDPPPAPPDPDGVPIAALPHPIAPATAINPPKAAILIAPS